MLDKNSAFSIYENISLPVLVFEKKSKQLIFLNIPAQTFLNDINCKASAFDDILNVSLRKFRCKEQNNAECFEFVTVKGKKWYEFRMQHGNIESRDIFTLLLFDITHEHKLEEAIKEVFRFRDMLYKMVEKNNSVSTVKVPDIINETLALTGDFFGCDRVYVYVWDQDIKGILKVAEWYSSDINIRHDGDNVLDPDTITWSLNRIFNDGLLLVNSVEKIFDRFWQSRRNVPAKGGTGLGLAITKAYVELLGGSIEIQSKLSEGTMFNVKIPVEIKS